MPPPAPPKPPPWAAPGDTSADAQRRAAALASAAGTTVARFDRSSYAMATNRGYGNAMGRGFELALTLVVFGGIGWVRRPRRRHLPALHHHLQRRRLRRHQ